MAPITRQSSKFKLIGKNFQQIRKFASALQPKKRTKPPSLSSKSNETVLKNKQSFSEWLKSAKEEFSAKFQNGLGSFKSSNSTTTSTSTLKDFKLLKTIGKGTFGRVDLAKNKITKDYVAIKIIKKQDLVEAGTEKDVFSEKRILSALNFPFIVKLHGCFKDLSYLYLVLEYAPGGDLYTLLQDMEKLPVKQAKFYVAQIVLIFEYLHSLQIVYRDLKLENLLLDKDGYVKLTDFGFATQLPAKGLLTRWCGTLEYMAPEITRCKGYNHSVDWWALGVLLFEMCSGKTPFDAEKNEDICKKAAAGIVNYPNYFGADLTDIVGKLLHVDSTKRLGSLENDPKDIKNHPFFHGINFDDLLQKKIVAPYRPRVKSPSDTSNFCKFPKKKLRVSLNQHFECEFADF